MVKSRRMGLSITIWFLLCCGASRSSADPLTFSFEGYVTFIHDYLMLDESLYLGAPLSGTYSFYPVGATDYYSNDPNVGLYQFGSSGRMYTQIGNYEFLTPDLNILIWNDLLGEDIYEPISPTPFPAAGYQWSIMRIVLSDRTGAALESDALPLTTPDLAAFGNARNFLLHLPGDDVGIGGVLTSLTPEPGSLAVFGVGAVALCCRRRR